MDCKTWTNHWRGSRPLPDWICPWKPWASKLDASLSRLAPGKLRKVRYRPGRDERAGDVTLAVFEYEMIGDIHGLAALLNGLHDFDAPLLTREICVKASPRREPPLDIRLQLGVISNVHENLKP